MRILSTYSSHRTFVAYSTFSNTNPFMIVQQKTVYQIGIDNWQTMISCARLIEIPRRIEHIKCVHESGPGRTTILPRMP